MDIYRNIVAQYAAFNYVNIYHYTCGTVKTCGKILVVNVVYVLKVYRTS